MERVHLPQDPLPSGSVLVHQLWEDPALIHWAHARSEKAWAEDDLVVIEMVTGSGIRSASVALSWPEQTR